METETHTQTVTATGGAVAVTFGHVGSLSGGVVGHQINNYGVVGESHFYDLEPAEISAREPALEPPLLDELAALLAESRLLILAGSLEDKGDVARRVAFRLSGKLAAEGKPVAVRERYRGKDPQRIEGAFHPERTTILLLTEISQALIAGYDPFRLRRLLLARGGYAIITTDCSRKQWDVVEGTAEARLWQELTWETYYGADRLATYLEQLLFGSDLKIPEGLVGGEPGGVPDIGGVPFSDAAADLKSPERILAFVTSLVDGQTEPTPAGVQALLTELSGDAAGIRQWYLQFDDRDQLLVVGLVLLDGLPDDLLFAGLEILVETTWRETDPNFAQFDYRDLSRFAAYFKQTPVDGGFLRVESGSRQRRADILQVAWNHQRRRLLATLPALTEMIRASAGQPAEEGAKPAEAEATPSAARLAAAHALSRSERGSIQLHQVVVESLSLIGLISIEVVEPYLLDLAADPTENVQLLVAQAMAVWREADEEDDFFSLLRRFWDEACNVGNTRSRIARAAAPGADPWAAVRATVAMTVGFAAQYDRENHLAAQLHSLLRVLVDDPHPRVRRAVRYQMLPKTIAWHLRELEPFLRERLFADADFVLAVARGAATACEMRPEEALPIVAGWWAEARADARHATPAHPGRREGILAAVAQTYGHVQAREGQEAMAPKVLVSHLRTILDEEGHPFVRRHALDAIATLTQNDPELAARILPDLLTRLALDDRPQVARLACRSYLHQRWQMRGGDRKLEIDGRTYVVWTDGKRPLAGIETTLYGWLMDGSRPVAQQVAVDTFALLSATALEREERKLRETRPRTRMIPSGLALAADPEVRGLGPFGRLAVVLATPGREELRPQLRPLMAEVLAQDRRHRAAQLRQLRSPKQKGPAATLQNGATPPPPDQPAEGIKVLLHRFRGERNASAQALGDVLERAVHLYRLRWPTVLVAALLLYGLGVLYVRIDREVAVRIEPLAAQVVPAPEVLLDRMAPLPPGQQAPLSLGTRFLTAHFLPAREAPPSSDPAELPPSLWQPLIDFMKPTPPDLEVPENLGAPLAPGAPWERRTAGRSRSRRR